MQGAWYMKIKECTRKQRCMCKSVNQQKDYCMQISVQINLLGYNKNE